MGGSGSRHQCLDACAAGILDVAGDDVGSLRKLLVGDTSVALDVCTEPQHLPFREDRSAAALDEQADGIRTDVDDPDRHASMVATRARRRARSRRRMNRA